MSRFLSWSSLFVDDKLTNRKPLRETRSGKPEAKVPAFSSKTAALAVAKSSGGSARRCGKAPMGERTICLRRPTAPPISWRSNWPSAFLGGVYTYTYIYIPVFRLLAGKYVNFVGFKMKLENLPCSGGFHMFGEPSGVSQVWTSRKDFVTGCELQAPTVQKCAPSTLGKHSD